MDTHQNENYDERLENAKSRAKVMGVLFIIPVFVISVLDNATDLLYLAVLLGALLAGAYWAFMQLKDKRDAREEAAEEDSHENHS